MCSNENSTTALVPYTLKTIVGGGSGGSSGSSSAADQSCAAAAAAAAAYMSSFNQNITQAALEHYRLQLYNYASYAERFRYAHPAGLSSPFALATSPYGPATAHHAHQHHHHQHHQQHHHQQQHHNHHHNHHHQGVSGGPVGSHDPFAGLSPYAKFDPRAYRLPEEPKPQHSYIGLIGMAILSSPEKKLVLSDIYQYILDNYPYFRARGPGWRNSIRHNLSLNDCFVKAGRSANGKGHYWAIHPANLEDFKKGDFRRRKAQRRVRKHMGLSVPEDEDSTSPPPQPQPQPQSQPEQLPKSQSQSQSQPQQLPPQASCSRSPGLITSGCSIPVASLGEFWTGAPNAMKPEIAGNIASYVLRKQAMATCIFPISRRRQFDMDSLLAPDHPTPAKDNRHEFLHSSGNDVKHDENVVPAAQAKTRGDDNGKTEVDSMSGSEIGSDEVLLRRNISATYGPARNTDWEDSSDSDSLDDYLLPAPLLAPVSGRRLVGLSQPKIRICEEVVAISGRNHNDNDNDNDDDEDGSDHNDNNKGHMKAAAAAAAAASSGFLGFSRFTSSSSRNNLSFVAAAVAVAAAASQQQHQQQTHLPIATIGLRPNATSVSVSNSGKDSPAVLPACWMNVKPLTYQVSSGDHGSTAAAVQSATFQSSPKSPVYDKSDSSADSK